MDYFKNWLKGFVIVSVVAFGLFSPAAAGQLNYKTDPPIDPLVQPSSMSCWAATGTMMKNWKDRVSRSIEDVVNSAGPQYLAIFKADTGLNLAEIAAFAKALNMQSEAPACYSVQGFASLMQNNGPLLVVYNPSKDPKTKVAHAVVATGISGDGSVENTKVDYTDPADGKSYSDTYKVFMEKFETVPVNDVQVQIAHF